VDGELTLERVHAAFGEWMAFPTDDETRPRYDLVDIALAVIIANRMEAIRCGCSWWRRRSSAKTEIIRSLSDVADVVPLSSLTPQTFASGFEKKGVETSLLPKLAGRSSR
jgi:hypothetical protein